MDLGAKIQKLREEKGITKYRLAEITGISHTHICNIENGAKIPTIETVSRLLEPLGVSLAEFFAEDDSLYSLSAREQAIIKIIRELPDEKAKMILDVLKMFANVSVNYG